MKLYRETHNSFKSYVREHFDFTRRAADYLISAAEVVENLKREQFVLGTHVLSTKESQCRSLAKLSPEEQRKAWCKAVDKAGGKIPTHIQQPHKRNMSEIVVEKRWNKEKERV